MIEILLYRYCSVGPCVHSRYALTRMLVSTTSSKGKTRQKKINHSSGRACSIAQSMTPVSSVLSTLPSASANSRRSNACLCSTFSHLSNRTVCTYRNGDRKKGVWEGRQTTHKYAYLSDGSVCMAKGEGAKLRFRVAK
jgi:hypothetical protein